MYIYRPPCSLEWRGMMARNYAFERDQQAKAKAARKAAKREAKRQAKKKAETS